MKRFVITAAAVLLALQTLSVPMARAAIDKKYWPTECRQQYPLIQEATKNILVVDAVTCNALYSQIQLLELIVSDLGFEKEIYSYDPYQAYDFDKSKKILITTSEIEFQSRNDGVALYIGKNQDGKDVFLLKFIKLVTNTDRVYAPQIYVKMAGTQVAITKLELSRP